MTGNRRAGGRLGVALIAAAAVMTVGVVLAQDPKTKDDPAKAAKSAAKPKSRKGGLFVPNAGKAKAAPKGADPFGKAAEAKKDEAPAPGTYHYTFKIHAADQTTLAALYYPSKLGTGSPAVILVHERDRSTKDFQDKVADLDNQGLAEALQKEGYAVLAFDLRGHGANARRALGAADWQAMVGDLQTAYVFLIDRHNRGELNLARLGVVALGEGANVATTWASVPEAATSSPGRAGDLAGLVLVSPMVDAQAQGLKVGQALRALAPRVPLGVLAGERDPASAPAVKDVRPAITRVPGNKIELFATSLHGFKLLRLEPGVARAIVDFLDQSLRAKAEEWEPRYNLAPATYSDVQTVLHTPPKADAAKAAPDRAK